MHALASPSATLTTNLGTPVPLAHVAASGKLNGLLFEMTIEQHYRNVSESAIESVYTFPLPLNAVLLAFELELNGVTHLAKAFGKQQAERAYETAIDEGNSAALLVDNGNGLFTVNVANLMPGETAVVRYRYAELLSAHKDHVRLTVPTAIAPRYGNPADANLGGPAVPNADAFAEYPFRLTLELAGYRDVANAHSPTHAITARKTEAGLSVEIARKGFLDRDFVLLLDGARAFVGGRVAADRDRFMSLASAVIEPGADDDRALVAKILLDCSGSMAGDSIEAAKRALAKLLDGMRPADRVSLSRFGSSVVHVTEGLEPADAHTLEPLKLLVSQVEADLGGTEMASAVQAAIRIAAPKGSAPDLVLITDGEVYAVDGVVETAVKSGHRLFVVAIGAAPNEALARKISERTGGACDFVVSGEAVEPAILRMFGRLRSAPRKIVQVKWPAQTTWTTPLPSAVFPNETLHLMAGFDERPATSVTITLETRDGVRSDVVLAIADGAVAGDAFSRMAAARRLVALPADDAKALAIDYQLASEHTSLVLVAERAEGRKAKDIPTTVAVPQMLAAGWGGSAMVAGAPAPASAPMPMRKLASMPVREMAMSECLDLAAPREGAKRFERNRLQMPGTRAPVDLSEAKVGLDAVRVALLAAVKTVLDAGGKLPESLDELEAIHPLPPPASEALEWVIAQSGLAPAIAIRAFLEVLDRDAGSLAFPTVTPETKLQIRRARKKFERLA
jgi:Ca-activated chloride channel family protein